MRVSVKLFFYQCGHRQSIRMPCENEGCRDHVQMLIYNFDTTCGACGIPEREIFLSIPGYHVALRQQLSERQATYTLPQCDSYDVGRAAWAKLRDIIPRAMIIHPNCPRKGFYRFVAQAPLKYKSLRKARRKFKAKLKKAWIQDQLSRLQQYEEETKAVSGDGESQQTNTASKGNATSSSPRTFLLDSENLLSSPLFTKVTASTTSLDAVCLICWGNLFRASNIEAAACCDGGPPVRLPCHDTHIFGLGCIYRALKASPQCPLDKTKFNIVSLDLEGRLAGHLLPKIRELELFNYGLRPSPINRIVFLLNAGLLFILLPLILGWDKYINSEENQDSSAMHRFLKMLPGLLMVMAAPLVWIYLLLEWPGLFASLHKNE